MRIDYSILPEGARPGMRDYIERGRLPGGFLQAVLANDFVTAVGRADETNSRALWNFAHFLYSEAPIECWGSLEDIRDWCASGGLHGRSTFPGPRESEIY